MIDPNLPRWIAASINKHFSSLSSVADVFIEDMDRNTRTSKNIIEIRLNGPHISECGASDDHLYYTVDILIQATLDQTDRYMIHRLVGAVVNRFTDIPVFRYGDDNTAIGCLQLQSERRGGTILVNNFGQIDVKVAITQSAVSGQYKFLSQGDN